MIMKIVFAVIIALLGVICETAIAVPLYDVCKNESGKTRLVLSLSYILLMIISLFVSVPSIITILH